MKYTKKILTFLTALAMVISAAGLFSCSSGGDPDDTENGTDSPGSRPEPAGKSFYVSPEGDDSNEGSQESPLATFSGAKNAVRSYKEKNGLPDGGIEVVFEPGTYKVTSQTQFAAEDSGEAGKPVVYRALESGTAVFDGGVDLDPSLFGPVSDGIKSRLATDEAKASVLEADLNAAGCYDLDDSRDYPNGWKCTSYRQELYVDNKKQNVARWPDSGYNSSAIYSDGGRSAYIEIPEEKAVLWADEKVRYYGYTVYDWSSVNLSEKTVSCDPDSSVIRISDVGYYAVEGVSKAGYYLYNMLCELDSPGEYFWDTAAGKLYYYPDGDLEGRKISFSQFADDWFVFGNASYISLEGLTFENGRACVFSGGTQEDTHDITFSGCVFRDLGGYPVNMTGYRIKVENCDMHDLGSGCVQLTGGIPNDVAASGSVITNNRMHDWAQTYTISNPALYLYGYGYTVSHNEMSDCPHTAIFFSCGGSVIEYNYIHDVCNETSDAGSVYAGRRWDWSGNILRYNYFENIVDRQFDGRPNGIYLDDNLSGQWCYGNVFKNIGGRCILVGGGKKNTIEYNVFIEPSRRPVSWDERGLGNEFMHDDVTYPNGSMWRGITSTVSYLSNMQRFAVPENLLLIETTGFSIMSRPDDPGTPSYGIVRDNISVGETVSNIAGLLDWGDVEGNMAYASDPGFCDLSGGDYSLREDSRVFRDIPGFVSVDFSQIGIQKGDR